MRVANYYRVSTKLQEKKFSLAAQKTELTNYAKNQGWTLIKEFKDVDSGGKLDKDGLNALLDCVEEGAIDVVLVISQDRLSRLDTVAWEFLKDTLRQNQVKIAEPGTVVDLSDEDQEFFSDLKNLMAKREKRSIVKKMMYGKRQRLREEKGWGRPPFEYSYDKNTSKYYAKEEWKWVIPFIDDLYLNHQLGMTLISQRLNEISSTPTGGIWNEHLIFVRLTSKAYHGVSEKDFDNGDTISVDGVYEQLRSKDTYERIQIERAKRTNQYSVAGRKSGGNTHLLKRTHLTCGKCGRKILICQHGTKKTPRYYAKHGRKKRLNGESCDISINTVRFDQNIINALKDILTNEELAKKYINIENDELEIKDLKKEIKKIEKELNALKMSLERLLDLYLSGGVKKDIYIERDKVNQSKVTIYEENLNKLYRKLKMLDSNKLNYEVLNHYMLIAKKIDTKLTAMEKAQLMGTLFPSGIVYEDKIVLITEVYDGIPIEVNIAINEDPNPFHFSKKH
ncbi:recombinase family protein [Cytobacillus sp. FSL K6-0129]|uniref:recombinase family protein n=1 Tax=Cytobacillus sp. FSL K6-0129 TaxID=2921421 RepID=UPI0030FB0576